MTTELNRPASIETGFAYAITFSLRDGASLGDVKLPLSGNGGRQFRPVPVLAELLRFSAEDKREEHDLPKGKNPNGGTNLISFHFSSGWS